MAYNEKLADRIREMISLTHKKVIEKPMFGGLCFMVNDKMCIGIIKDEMMCRIDPDTQEVALSKIGCRIMDFTGRPMKGYVFVDIDALNTKTKLKYWVDLALDYNKIAKASKKKKPIH
jgi:TfoX/Sxy family transcriptional regulator of competence genes